MTTIAGAMPAQMKNPAGWIGGANPPVTPKGLSVQAWPVGADVAEFLRAHFGELIEKLTPSFSHMALQALQFLAAADADFILMRL
jgi:hypothetical protein